MRQIEIIQKDLCDSHEHFGTLHPSVVAPNGDLQVWSYGEKMRERRDLEDTASVALVED